MSALQAVALAPKDGMRDRVRNFFYSQEIPYGIALVRIMITFTLLWVMVPRGTSRENSSRPTVLPSRCGIRTARIRGSRAPTGWSPWPSPP